MRSAGFALLLVAACGPKSAPPSSPIVKTEQPPPKVEASAPACIKELDETVPITHAIADGTRVKYCVGNTDACFSLDTATGAFERLPEPPKSNELLGARVETTNPELKICQMESCTTLTPNVLPASSQLRAATNASGTIAVFLLGDAQSGKGYAEVWDVTLTKKLATFKYARGEFKCGNDVAIIDDTVYVSASSCRAPAARATLYTLRGKRIANVGGPDYGVYGDAYAAVDVNQWAFLEENGNQIVIQDLVKGKIIKKIDTSALFKETGGAMMGNPGESALVRISPGKLAVIGGAPATGHVATVDVASGEVKVLKATVCP